MVNVEDEHKSQAKQPDPPLPLTRQEVGRRSSWARGEGKRNVPTS